MQTFSETKKKQIVGALLLIAAVLLLASWYIKEKQQDYRAAVSVKIAEQEVKLVSFAELLDRDSADAVVNQVVKDCEQEERIRFDSLLSNLSQLNRADLLEVDALFPACGSFYADRQAILTIRFTREMDIYREYIDLLELTGTSVETYRDKLKQWQTLHDIETERSALKGVLVEIQDEIITLLVDGKSAQSDAINEKLERAQGAKDSLSLLNAKADTLRGELSTI